MNNIANNMPTPMQTAGQMAVGTTPILNDAPPAAGEKKIETGPILPTPSVTVTTKSTAERLLSASFDSALNTAKNLVDTPEVRARKAADRARAERRDEIRAETDIRAEARAAEREIASVRLTQTGGTLDLIDA